MSFRVTALSDIGKVRKSNEDSWGAFPDASLFVVADGMGGHKAGDVASHLAVQTIYEVLKGKQPPLDSQVEQASHYLNDSIQRANLRIYEEGKKNPGRTGMGTTVVAVWMGKGSASIAYVGDSRAYLLRKSHLRLVTSDHTLVNDYVSKGLLQPNEAEQHPLRHVLSKAVGPQEHVEADLINLATQPGDIFLLCTDGLSNMVSKDLMEEILNSPDELIRKNEKLIQVANESGGSDNVTALLIECT